jgi:excisionase family DNA binding protein
MTKKPGPSKPIEQHFSINQIAAKLSVHRSTIERLLYSGKLGYYQLGRRRIVSEEELKRYLSLIEHEPTRTKI